MIKGIGDRFYVIGRDGKIRGEVSSFSKVVDLIKKTPDLFCNGDGKAEVKGVFTNFRTEISENTTVRDLENAWKSYQSLV